MTMRLDFVRGHMGGNLIILLRGDQIPIGRELETAVKLLGPDYLSAHEAGILYPTDQDGQIEVKIAEATLPSFISACGGLTQVLGAALIETELGKLFGVEQDLSSTEIMLHTDCGPVNLTVDVHESKALRIKTDMECFINESYDRGVGFLQHKGIEVMQAGKFLVINADRFKEVYPNVDFRRWDSKTRQSLLEIQHEFQEKTGEIEPNVAVYDWNPEYGGHLRVVFPHSVETEYIEPSCGTGSVALGIAVLACGELDHFKDLSPDQSGQLLLNIESGGGIELGGPEITALEMKIDRGFVKSAAFSHSRVEITLWGRPFYEFFAC